MSLQASNQSSDNGEDQNGNDQSGPSVLRYGVIGTGMMGVEHIQNILALDNCVVSAVADPHQESLDMAQLAVGLETPLAKFETIEELIASELCDALVIASPNHTHHAVLIPAIESGLHLLVEKPLCTTLADCRDVLDRAAQRSADHGDQVIWMGLEYRYMPPLRRLMAELESGSIGDVKMVAIREHRFPFLVKVDNWNRFSKNSGGTLVEKCCHFFDLMMRATRSRPVRVMASGAQDVNHLDEVYDGEPSDIMDNAYVIVDFANGKLEALDTESVVRIGKRTDDIISGINVVTEEKVTDVTIKHQGLHHGASYLEHVDFAEAIRAGRSADVTLLDGLWAAAIGFAAHRSIETGLPVTLDELPELEGLAFTP